MSRRLYGFIAVLVGIIWLASGASAAVTPSVTITLSPSVPSPELLGTSILWTATVQGEPGHTYDYQFSAALQGQNQVVRDFDLPNSFTWVPWTVEGTYIVTVRVRDITTQPYILFPAVSQQYVIQPIVTQSGASAVNPTSHPLVALFSAGPCTVGHSIRVRFRQNGSQTMSSTNAVSCSSTSANFLVAGMLPATQYEMHWEEFANNYDQNGSDLSFTTGHLPNDFPINEHMNVDIPPSGHDADFPVVIFHLLPTVGSIFQYWPAATDVNGNILWYHHGQALLTRMEVGGNHFTMSYTKLNEYDLAGNLLLQTNIEILNEQLVARGFQPMTGLNNHETRRLPNGNLLILGSRHMTSTQYQGATQQHPVDILGDMILVLDHNMQLVWAWDSFAHQDLSREATLDDLCYHLAAGCPPFNQSFPTANDWTHANSAQLTSDGNILLSERSQDWVLKINYGNGSGDGHLIWRMGPYGDFTLLNPPGNPCGDPNVFPWFTHQHDAAFQAQGGFTEVMTVFDDGNTRHQQCGGGNSRGMILSVSESMHTVYQQMLSDLGHYSVALGSAQLLSSPPDPLFASFGNGLLFLPADASIATETDLSGNLVYELQASQWSYRTYRARDLYTPTLP